MEISVPAPPATAWHTPSTENAAPRSWLGLGLVLVLVLGLANPNPTPNPSQEGLASAAGRLSLLRLLRRGAMLALLIAVWPLLLAGLVLRWWTLTPSVARASFLQEGLTSRLGLG